MKKLIAIISIIATAMASCSKKSNPVPVPQPTPVKITFWSIGNQSNLSRWGVFITIDKVLDEDVVITCTFTSSPDQQKVTVPVSFLKGYTSWQGSSTVAPASVSSIGLNPTFTIKGTKQYTLTW